MRIRIISFSPTGNSRTAASAFASRFTDAQISCSDITCSDPEDSERMIDEDLVILASPVYEGKIPSLAQQRLSLFQGNSSMSVCMVTYGMIEFGSSLLQLEGLCGQISLEPVLSIAVPARHSYSTPEAPLGRDRPSVKELQLLKGPVTIASQTPDATPLLARLAPEDSIRFIAGIPGIDALRCISCGRCLRSCPAQAISLPDYAIDRGSCIRCYACIAVCPVDARRGALHFTWLRKKLFRHIDTAQASPEFFRPACSPNTELPAIFR